MTTIVLITLAYLTVATLLAVFLGRVLRLRNLDGPDVDWVCIEPGCGRRGTHERLVGVTTTAVPAGDPDGFSWVVERVCRRHVEVAR